MKNKFGLIIIGIIIISFVGLVLSRIFIDKANIFSLDNNVLNFGLIGDDEEYDWDFDFSYIDGEAKSEKIYKNDTTGRELKTGKTIISNRAIYSFDNAREINIDINHTYIDIEKGNNNEIEIKGSSGGEINLENGKISINANNAKIKITAINPEKLDINIKASNGKIDIEDTVSILKVDLMNGYINIDGDRAFETYVNIDNGKVIFDKDFPVNGEIKSRNNVTVTDNYLKTSIIRSGKSVKFGTYNGNEKTVVNMSNGVVKFED